ncbi:MAG: carbon monoxide dehydrogenase, partial [Deltaproteobacteria bacterium]|nr:carbon monoxide dehydrogenase [Deltaproteobacteria bacterium]
MSLIIGMAGKGGTGKTTLAGMAVRYLASVGKVPILAVDA